MLPLKCFPYLALFAQAVLAIHESEAGVVDWQRNLVGIPRSTPIFHRVTGHEASKSLIVTATLSNVLAAIDPLDGSIAWRHVLAADDQVLLHKQHGEVVTTLSGPGGSILRVFNVLTGDLLHESLLHQPNTGFLTEPANIGASIAFSSTPNVHVLTNGHTVRSIDTLTYKEAWKWTSEDEASLVIFSNIIATRESVFVVGLTKSFASFTLHVTTLSSSSGEVLSQVNVPSIISKGMDDFVVVSEHLVWIENGSLKSLPLTDLEAKPSTSKGAFESVADVGSGLLVAHKADGRADVLLVKDGQLQVAWEFPAVDTSSIYSGGVDKNGYPYVSRVYWSSTLRTVFAEVYAPHLSQGAGLVSGYTIPFDTSVHGIIKQVSLDAASLDEMTIASRLVFSTSTGALQLWQHDKVQWTREESLATIQLAEFVELPEVQQGAREVESFTQRLSRQLSDAQGFPHYLTQFVKRFATGSHATVVASHVDTDTLSRDAFGFRQLIIVATAYGKIYALDSTNGKIVWSRILSLGPHGQQAGSVKPLRLLTVKTVGDGQGDPEIALVAQRRNDLGDIETVVYHFNALTAIDIQTGVDAPVMPEAALFPGPVADVIERVNGSLRYMLLVDKSLQVNFFPGNPYVREDIVKNLPLIQVPLLRAEKEAGARQLRGYKILNDPVLGYKFTGYSTWQLALPDEEDVQTIVHPSKGPIASFGKVLGNRTTLYKYLNPNLFAVLTTTHSVQPTTCGVYVADAVKGSIIYRAHLPSHAGACNIKLTMMENWLVYHYYDEKLATDTSTKGYRIVSVEFYEGKQVDDKTKSSELSSYDPKSLDLTAIEQSYIFAHGITAITTTSTKFGIAAKDVIVATTNHRVQSLPRIFLNPRRPTRKVTTEEQEERLVSYDPIFPEDPRRVLSHNYDVANVKNIVTAPALLESTSLVLAYGLDLFLTRVAPSNTFDVLSESFNKAQLILTVSALAVAIMITKPMVRRKRLREKWYTS